jgi:hypothetical protein
VIQSAISQDITALRKTLLRHFKEEWIKGRPFDINDARELARQLLKGALPHPRTLAPEYDPDLMGTAIKLFLTQAALHAAQSATARLASQVRNGGFNFEPVTEPAGGLGGPGEIGPEGHALGD